MEKHEYLITITFVLIIGLLGGYMIGQHAGHAEAGHESPVEHQH